MWIYCVATGYTCRVWHVLVYQYNVGKYFLLYGRVSRGHSQLLFHVIQGSSGFVCSRKKARKMTLTRMIHFTNSVWHLILHAHPILHLFIGAICWFYWHRHSQTVISHTHKAELAKRHRSRKWNPKIVAFWLVRTHFCLFTFLLESVAFINFTLCYLGIGINDDERSDCVCLSFLLRRASKCE